MKRRFWVLVALFSAGVMLVLAGNVLASTPLTKAAQVSALIGLAIMFAAEAIRGLRGAS